MTIYNVDEFVVCEYSAWDADFTPPTTEWDSGARAPAPTDGEITLCLFARPGVGDIVLPSPENGSIALSVDARAREDITISSPENAEIALQVAATPATEICLPAPENAAIILPVTAVPGLQIVLPAPENAEISLPVAALISALPLPIYTVTIMRMLASVSKVEKIKLTDPIVTYRCILTGAENGLSDIVIPISNFKIQKRVV